MENPRLSIDAKDIVKFVLLHTETIDTVMELFQKANITQAEAELICAWIIGLSAGMRQASMTNHPALEYMARAWQFAVKHTHD